MAIHLTKRLSVFAVILALVLSMPGIALAAPVQLPMSAKNPPHAATTLCASDYLKRLLAEVALVQVPSIGLTEWDLAPELRQLLLVNA